MELIAPKVKDVVEPGFKRTEVGSIPEDWDVVKLRSHCQVITKGTTPTSIGRSFQQSGINFIKAETLTEDGGIVQAKVAYIDEGTHRILSRSQLQANDVLFSIAGVLGRTGVVSEELLPANTNQALAIIRLAKGARMDHGYLLRVLNSTALKKHVEGINVQAAQANLSLENVGDFPIPVPPIEEQRAIATTLSDVDGLLAGLDALIAKKKALKQGAMQQLLTGKQRLPGFKGEWVVKPLGELGDITGAGVDKLSKPGEKPVRLLNYMDVFHKDFIRSSEIEHWVTAPAHKAERCAIQQGDIFFTPSSETRSDIALAAVALEDVPDTVYSYHLVRLRLKEPWDLRFRTYAFKTRHFISQAETMCEGSGTRYVITLKKFRELTVHYPPGVKEQTAIAEVLSDMDAELAALEARRAKTALLKQGMMQELLTGRTRLV